MLELTQREEQEIHFAKIYADDFSHGTDGHSRLLLIARLATALQKHDDRPSASEAVWAFAARLTILDGEIVVGSKHEPHEIIEQVNKFIADFDLPKARDDWPDLFHERQG